MSDFRQHGQSGGPKWVKKTPSESSLSLCNFFSLVLPVSIPGCSPWMSTCQFQDNLPFHTFKLERVHVPCSQAHIFSECHTTTRKELFGSSRHSLVTNPKVPRVPKRGSRMTLLLIHINARGSPSALSLSSGTSFYCTLLSDGFLPFLHQ